ncbi:uncharacterized protein LOC120260122 [Dioscorea cayenensis subsp. rotundata]|uniref:Uncharacterized protein LOC120260122 n=1 Tax=Dioscorea cayennensis subsp. rotundata TaxID=55577 RepID=A0AB40B9T6_DIOCR|nr:uncharacterized protein LOC120260122 [Dioscorea cayenensis subsp. rotundata]
MGNCMETCSPPWYQEDIKEKEWCGLEKDGVFKVKVVLTRRELEWLMLQLKDKRERRLHDLVMEIDRERRQSMKVQKWTPALASIMESPEFQTFETTT